MSLFAALRRSLDREQLVAQVTVISEAGLGRKALFWPDGRREGELGPEELDSAAAKEVEDAFAAQRTGPVTVEGEGGGEVELFVEVFPPPPKLIVVGAVHVAIPLVSLANTLGYHTVVLDARATFATGERFPHADELIVRWPADALADMVLHESTYLVFLSHDDKLDNPALVVALASDARYIGALGSKRTHARRVADLEQRGVSAEAIARIHAPIGLDLGGRRPEEIAVAIVAQIVQARHGRA